jgi:Protein of unknown function (DUF2929)
VLIYIVRIRLEIEVKTVRFFLTFFWTLLLINMTSYVVNSMTGGQYDFMSATILSVVATLVIFLIAKVIPIETAAEPEHH